ncbi:hypothetical protein BCR44DRAFT_37538 [Catenaria anguillulae PL171]|uniref:F-box domain-containing protein n=1 Tax=Catenaria anguillulae PL171 TaxID=765915 RepID=A0A1Y2HZ62_9FUNG|nr:hypothetical protein BCR44DRAFT_37538 [Catenaria anguillulae PL171]
MSMHGLPQPLDVQLATLRSHISGADDNASASDARRLAALPKHVLRTEEHQVFALLNLAIQNDLPQAVSEILLLLDPEAILWDEIAPHAVFQDRPNALRSILSHPQFPGFEIEVFYSAHQNGSSEILELLVGLGDIDDVLSAIQFAYEDCGFSNRVVMSLDRAHVALADALIHGPHAWRPLCPEPVHAPQNLPAKPLQSVDEASTQTLITLPYDIVAHLVTFLDIKSLIRLRQACKIFHDSIPIEPFHHFEHLENLAVHIFNATHVAHNAQSMLQNLLQLPMLAGYVEEPEMLQYLAAVRAGDDVVAHKMFLQLNKEYTAMYVGFDLILQSIAHVPPCETIPAGFLNIFSELLHELSFESWYSFLHVPAFQRSVSLLEAPSLCANPTADQFTFSLMLSLVQGNQERALDLLQSIRDTGTRATAMRDSLGHTIVVASRFGLLRVLNYVLDTMWVSRDFQKCLTVCGAWCYAIAGENGTALDMLLAWLPHTFDYLSIGNDDELQASLRAAGKVGRLDWALKLIRHIGMVNPMRTMAHVIVPWAVPRGIGENDD